MSLSPAGAHLNPVVQRCASPSELNLMARITGLGLKESWGSWDREPFLPEPVSTCPSTDVYLCTNSITADQNLFWNSRDQLLGANALQADPLLDLQYHLSAASPAREAGTIVPLSIDFDGDPRPNGAYDLGADEYYPKIYLPLVRG